MSDFQNIVAHAIETSKKLGAQDARILARQTSSMNMAWRKQKIETMTSATESSIILTLFVDGKYGQFLTSDMRAESLDAFIDNCIKMTRLLEEDPAQTLADPSRYENRSTDDLDIYDPKAEAMTPNDLVEYCKALEALSLAHTELPITDVTVEFEVSLNSSFMATTNGFSGDRKSTSFSGGTSFVLTDGDKKPSDHAYSSARYFDDLRTQQQLADDCARFCAMKLGQKKLPTANRTIIFDRRVASSLIQNYLSPLDGMALVLKSSYFQDKLGQKLASDLFDITDNPLIKRGLGSRTYDPEGVSLHPMPIFEKGTLKQYYLDTYASNKLGMTPTTGYNSSFVLTPGTRSLDEMIADVKDGIYVTGLLGGNQDNTRGDFSHGIVGVAIENGKLTTPVSEMNITGNHTDLWQHLSEVGNDVRTDTTHRIPSIRIDDIAVSGS
ncbi:MAG: TldD/PmbA family protein [Proteobacteria bacterium]|nr:TldD/PmbA family protein [Pseudomonadota bacterium]